MPRSSHFWNLRICRKNPLQWWEKESRVLFILTPHNYRHKKNVFSGEELPIKIHSGWLTCPVCNHSSWDSVHFGEVGDPSLWPVHTPPTTSFPFLQSLSPFSAFTLNLLDLPSELNLSLTLTNHHVSSSLTPSSLCTPNVYVLSCFQFLHFLCFYLSYSPTSLP